MKQLNKDQAIAFYESKVWEDMSNQEIVKMQLFQDKLCMPFDVFHEAIEEVLGRSVFSHEFAWREALRKEFLGEKPAPTLDEIISAIPSNKLTLLLD